MADRTSTVRVNVVTDASGGISGLSKFGKLAGAAALGVGALVGGAVIGAGKLYAFGDAADDANASIETGLKTMKLFGKQTDDVAARIEAQAKAVSNATATDINSIKATQAKLLTFKDLAKTADDAGGAFDRATQAAVDMAAKGFGTAETNAVQLGKALGDPANGLAALKKTGALTADQIKTIGDEFKKTGDISKAQGDILSAVERQVGGTAAAQAGGFEIMQTKLRNFGQELATKALPYLDRFGVFLTDKVGPALVQFGGFLQENVVPVLQRFGQFVGERIVPALVRLGGYVQENILPVLSKLGQFIGDKVVPVLTSLAGFVIEHVIPAFGKLVDGVLKGAQGMFKNVADAIGDNKPQLESMADKLKKVGTFLVDNVLPFVGKLAEKALPALGDAIGIAIGVIGGIYDAFSKVYDIIASVVGKVQDFIDKLKNIPHPDLPFLGRTGADGASGTSANGQFSPFQHQPGSVTLQIGTLVSGSDEETARKLQRILDASRRRKSGVPA